MAGRDLLVRLRRRHLFLQNNSPLVVKKKRELRFQPGDRVAEKPKPRQVLTHDPLTKQKIRPFTTQRYGVVVDTVYKTNDRGAKVPYVQVTWDNMATPSLHSQNRLCLESELAEFMAAYCVGE